MRFKTHEEALNYCESIAFCNDQIRRAIADARYLLALQQGASDYRPTNNKAEIEDGQLLSVEIKFNGKKYQVLLPESWLQAYVFALKKFKEEFGEVAYNSIATRYNKGWDVAKIYTTENIGRRTWNNRREKFLALFALVAAQFDLIYID